MIEPKSGSRVNGKAVLTASNGKVTLRLRVQDAPPGTHAMHVHEKGDCSSNDAESAGAHWNPTGEEHGKWGAAAHHLGDVGNLDVGAGGTGTLTFITERWTLGGDAKTDVLGKSLVVHANIDDFQTQPAGNAGRRIACGVIKAGR